MMIYLRLFTVGSLLIVGAAPLEAAEPSIQSDYAKVVKPFLATHCFRCHDEKRANSGFRIDQLGADFTAAKGAERWKEVLDRINLGDMPPKEEPRPDIREIEPVVAWITDQLREVERAAKNAGGRIPMRRLNRTEYANTVRDLLRLDENFVRPLIEELPGDGKAEGFDRLGVALFFDQTQMEQALGVAQKLAAKAIVDDAPPKSNRVRFEPELQLAKSEAKRTGSTVELLKFGPSGITAFNNIASGRRNPPWGVVFRGIKVEDVVTQEGYYRIRVACGADAGERGEPIRLRFDYGSNTPVAATCEIDVTGTLDKPTVVEEVVFLRPGVPGQQQSLVVQWNDLPDLIQSNPAHARLDSTVKSLTKRVQALIADRVPQAEVQVAQAKLEEAKARLEAFAGSSRIYNPAYDLERVPRLFVDFIEIEGPVQTAPPAASLRWEAEKEIQPHVERTKHPFAYDDKTRTAQAGPAPHTIVADGVEMLQGGDMYRRDFRWSGRIGNLNLDSFIEEDGYYRIRLRAGADVGARGEPIEVHFEYGLATPIQAEGTLVIDAPLKEPRVFEMKTYLRRGDPAQKRKLGLMWNDQHGVIESTPDFNRFYGGIIGGQNKIAQALAAKAPSDEVDALRATRDALLREAAAWDGPIRRYKPDLDPTTAPRLFVDYIEVEGPIRDEWPPASHKQIFFADKELSDDDYTRQIFARLLPKAYRRPVTEAELEGVVRMVVDAQQRWKLSHVDAVRLGLERVLCSPGFWFIQEPTGDSDKPRRLNDYELASRLSYFLWSTMPDEKLLALAAADRLHEPQTLAAQVRRMSADPKSRELIKNFAGQWLQVADFGSVMPAAEYKDYDKALEAASKEEALAFFAEVFDRNLSVTNFLNSDFVVINERLAKHYGIEGVKGLEFRRVAIGPEHHRGGILGFAGLLTLLADGTRTLPIRRAAWVTTNLFDDPPGNPPPNAGEIQSNTSGENLTVRQRLDLHRTETTCASCHAKLDPWGLALENYDAIGKWRERANGEGFRANKAPLLDVSGTLPGGRTFTTLEEYKAALLESKDRFACAFAGKLLTYALGRPVGFTDGPVLDELVHRLQSDDYRIQSLVQAVVAHEVFQTK